MSGRSVINSFFAGRCSSIAGKKASDLGVETDGERRKTDVRLVLSFAQLGIALVVEASVQSFGSCQGPMHQARHVDDLNRHSLGPGSRLQGARGLHI